MQNSRPDADKILSKLKAESLKEIFIYDSIGSTNTEAKAYCRSGGKLPALFIAREQTAGRGRLGRSFESRRGGLYMTIAFRPSKGASPHSLTLSAGCAVLLAIERAVGVTPEIKWVNDIVIDGKKAAGILAEGSFSDDGNMSYAAVGIGVNLASRDFPRELRDIAGTLEDMTGILPDINSLCADIVNEFFSLTESFEDTLGIYRSHSSTVGKQVTVYGKGLPYEAYAKEIDGEGNLVVVRDGVEEKLFFGEISVRSAD